VSKISLVLTVIGPDRPGLVEAIADVVAAHGASWLESRMAHLAGQFAGILQVEVDVQQRDNLISGLAALEKLRLETVIHPDSRSSGASDGPTADGPSADDPFGVGEQPASGQFQKPQAQVQESQQGPLAEVAAGAMGQRGTIVCLELVGQDHPGIVREVTRVLADSSVNVEELQTERASAPGTGQLLFRASARLQLPEGVTEEALRQALEQVAGDLMVDLQLS
jgi:glycine cleavage system regulatory protein